MKRKIFVKIKDFNIKIKYKNLDEVLKYQGNPIGVAMAGEGVIDLYKD